MDIFMVFSFLGGLALFLYGMRSMGQGLEALGGGSMKALLARLCSTTWRGVLVGAAVTAAIQICFAAWRMVSSQVCCISNIFHFSFFGPAKAGSMCVPKQGSQGAHSSARASRRRARSAPLNSAPMMRTTAVRYSQISTTITVPMEPYSRE